MRFIALLFACFFFASITLGIDPPPAAMKLIEEFKIKEKAAKAKLEAEIAALRARAAKETEENKKTLIVELQKIRAALEAEEKHNEARAVAARIRAITSPVPRASDAPLNMTGYISNPANIDKSFIFRVTGKLDGGTVWGTGPYTSDSDLYKAAVHSGVVANGEAGMIKVTLISTAGIDFAGNTQNGVTTSTYTSWPQGYRIDRVTSEEAEGVIEAEDPIESLDSTEGAVPPGSTSPAGAEKTIRRSGRFVVDVF